MKNLRNCYDLINTTVTMGLSRSASNYYLKYAWWFIEPFMQFGALFIVFGIFQGPRMAYYADFLLCGIIAWQWFARGVNNNTNSILVSDNVRNIYPVHALFFPIITFIQDTIKFLFVFITMLLFFVFTKGAAAPWLCLPLIFVGQGIFVLGTGMLSAALVPFIPDLRMIIGFLVSLMFFASGVFFDISAMVHPQYKNLLYLNPMAVYIDAYRSVLSLGQMPDFSLLLSAILISLVFLVLAVLLVMRFNRLYTRISR